MDRLNSMQIFVEVARASGFTAAANKIGLSRAQVSKSIMQLEQHLGTRLFNRTTRRISLTEVGQIYLERCIDILQTIDETEAIAAAQTSEPRGRLTLSAPTSFGILHLQQAIPLYLRQHPQVQISLNLADRFIDVVDEGFDLVIRIAELPEQDNEDIKYLKESKLRIEKFRELSDLMCGAIDEQIEELEQEKE